ncbi:MAG: hypothetical protein FWG27_08395 [Treponema sp.]|nr:hypothetical protein [Treponema sp.]
MDKHNKQILLPGVGWTALTVLIHPLLLKRGLRCISTVLRKFFFFQYRSALFPHLPVSRVEHTLDDKIPFNPLFIRIYLDFSAFWIRILGFLCRHGKQGRVLAADFITSITDLYSFAFLVYSKNLSTTDRPRYKKGMRFRLVHLLDPHLMCVPSLHVMLVIHGYTVLRRFLYCLGKESELNGLAEKTFKGAQAIAEAILYVKQHSINCIAASLYAMRHFDSSLFSAADAEVFVQGLFSTEEAEDIPGEYAPYYKGPLIQAKDMECLRKHIMELYGFFMNSDNNDWTAPILNFFKTLPQKPKKNDCKSA